MSNIFESNGHQNFNTGEVELVVNGTSKGKVSPNGQTLGAFIKYWAKYYGLRTFGVYQNGQTVDTNSAAINAAPTGKVELVAKDSRG